MDSTLKFLLLLGGITVLISYSKFSSTEDKEKRKFYQVTGFVGSLIFLLTLLHITNIF